MFSSDLIGANLALLLVATGLIAISALKWRAAVITALILAVFEGVLRKWVLPEFGQWVYFAKDLLLIGAYAGFWGPKIVQGQKPFASHPANGILAVFSVLAVAQLANPSLPNIMVGLFGIKAYLIYMPLMYMVPSLFQDIQGLKAFWSWYLLLAVIPLILGIMQFWASPDSVLNRYAWGDELGPRVATFGSMGKPRITGTFSYITGYATYLTLIFLMGVSWVISEGRKRTRWALYGVLGLGMANLLMTGSRGPLIVLGASVVMLLALSSGSGELVRQRAMMTTCLVLPVTGLLVSHFFPEAHAMFFERARETEDLSGRLTGILSNPLWAIGEADPFGYGIGTTHQAMRFLTSRDASDTTPMLEGEWERIIFEVGPFGFVMLLLARLLVVSQLWGAFRMVQGTGLQPYAATALLFSLVSIPGNLVFNHTASLFYWFLAGIGLMAAAGMPSGMEQLTHPITRPERRREHAS